MTDTPIQSALNEFSRAVELFRERLKRDMSRFQKLALAADQYFKSLSADPDTLNRMRERLVELGKHLQDAFDALPDLAREAFRSLAMHGWYPDLDMALPEINALVRPFLDDQIEQGHVQCEGHFTSRLSGIESGLVTTFPLRKSFISKAFKAHRNRDYELSVPQFLIQADGICHDLINIDLYRKSQRRPVIASFVDDAAFDSFRRAFLTPLIEVTPLTESYAKSSIHDDVLNRHQVLHGVSLDYATKRSSLKAVSLLSYVAAVLSPT